jgi:hypothetical protein
MLYRIAYSSMLMCRDEAGDQVSRRLWRHGLGFSLEHDLSENRNPLFRITLWRD